MKLHSLSIDPITQEIEEFSTEVEDDYVEMYVDTKDDYEELFGVDYNHDGFGYIYTESIISAEDCRNKVKDFCLQFGRQLLNVGELLNDN